MFGNSEVDESTRHRFDITTANTVNLTKYELVEFVKNTTELGDTHRFIKTQDGQRHGKTVVIRVTGTTPTGEAKILLEQMLGNKSKV